MKKLLFGMAFMGSVLMTGVTQEVKANPGDPDEEFWVCCSITLRIWCTDRMGYEEGNSYKKFATTCS